MTYYCTDCNCILSLDNTDDMCEDTCIDCLNARYLKECEEMPIEPINQGRIEEYL